MCLLIFGRFSLEFGLFNVTKEVSRPRCFEINDQNAKILNLSMVYEVLIILYNSQQYSTIFSNILQYKKKRKKKRHKPENGEKKRRKKTAKTKKNGEKTKKQNGTEIPGDGPPPPRAPGKKYAVRANPSLR